MKNIKIQSSDFNVCIESEGYGSSFRIEVRVKGDASVYGTTYGVKPMPDHVIDFIKGRKFARLLFRKCAARKLMRVYRAYKDYIDEQAKNLLYADMIARLERGEFTYDVYEYFSIKAHVVGFTPEAGVMNTGECSFMGSNLISEIKAAIAAIEKGIRMFKSIASCPVPVIFKDYGDHRMLIGKYAIEVWFPYATTGGSMDGIESYFNGIIKQLKERIKTIEAAWS